jgi:hypothetical protein
MEEEVLGEWRKLRNQDLLKFVSQTIICIPTITYCFFDKINNNNNTNNNNQIQHWFAAFADTASPLTHNI